MTGDGAVTIALREKDERIAELEWAIAQWHAEEDDWVRDRATLDAEMAALKATVHELAKMRVDAVGQAQLERDAKVQADAELAALKARRCETCNRKARGCSIREIALRLYGGRDFGCQFWTWASREDGES